MHDRVTVITFADNY